MHWQASNARRSGIGRTTLSFWIAVLLVSSLMLIWQLASAMVYVSYWPAQVVTTTSLD